MEGLLNGAETFQILPCANSVSILYCYVSVYKETSTNDFHLNKSIRSFGFQYQLYLFEVNKCVWIRVGKCSIGKPLFIFNLLSLCLYEWTHVGRLHCLTSNFFYLFNYILSWLHIPHINVVGCDWSLLYLIVRRLSFLPDFFLAFLSFISHPVFSATISNAFDFLRRSWFLSSPHFQAPYLDLSSFTHFFFNSFTYFLSMSSVTIHLSPLSISFILSWHTLSLFLFPILFSFFF